MLLLTRISDSYVLAWKSSKSPLLYFLTLMVLTAVVYEMAGGAGGFISLMDLDDASTNGVEQFLLVV